MTCGTYSIYNWRTGIVYFGKSVDIEARWNQHRREIMRGENHDYRACYKIMNQHFQLYGLDSFWFSIMNIAPDGLTNDEKLEWNTVAEQKLLDWCFEHKKQCYNRAFVSGGVNPAQQWYVRRVGDAEWILIDSMTEFCHELSMSPYHMYDTANPDRPEKSHKGWQAKYTEWFTPMAEPRRNSNSRNYIFISPFGEIITNKTCFDMTKQYKLNPNHLRDVANFLNGTPVKGGYAKHHKGWKAYYEHDFPTHYPHLIPGATSISQVHSSSTTTST